MSKTRTELEFDRNAQNVVQKTGVRQRKSSLRFSMKSVLLLFTFLCVGMGIISNEAVRNQRAMEYLEGPEVVGEIRSFRSIWFASFTPKWIQDSVGEKYFLTPDKVCVKIRFLQSEALLQFEPSQTEEIGEVHNGKQVVESLSRFSSLSHLELQLSQLELLAEGENQLDEIEIDVSSLRGLDVYQFDVDSNIQLAADLVETMKINRLGICSCEFSDPLISSIRENGCIRELEFQMAKISANEIVRINELNSVGSVNFVKCRPTENLAGSIDILSDPYPTTGQKLWLGVSANASDWFDSNLSGFSISGLGSPTKTKQ